MTELTYDYAVRVLVVDDSKAVQARIVARLQEVPGVADVTGVSDPKTAFALATAYKPDIIILDVHTRDGTSLHLLRMIRARIPIVIVLTNSADEHHRRECFKHGADFFFDKFRELERVVEVVVTTIRERSLKL